MIERIREESVVRALNGAFGCLLRRSKPKLETVTECRSD